MIFCHGDLTELGHLFLYIQKIGGFEIAYEGLHIDAPNEVMSRKKMARVMGNDATIHAISTPPSLISRACTQKISTKVALDGSCI